MHDWYLMQQISGFRFSVPQFVIFLSRLRGQFKIWTFLLFLLTVERISKKRKKKCTEHDEWKLNIRHYALTFFYRWYTCAIFDGNRKSVAQSHPRNYLFVALLSSSTLDIFRSKRRGQFDKVRERWFPRQIDTDQARFHSICRTVSWIFKVGIIGNYARARVFLGISRYWQKCLPKYCSFFPRGKWNWFPGKYVSFGNVSSLYPAICQYKINSTIYQYYLNVCDLT